MINIEHFAGQLYEAYRQSVGKAWNESWLPSWEDLRADPMNKKQIDAWAAVARTAYNLNT